MARISAKERKLAETLADPVLWGQAYLRNRDGQSRVYWPHQVDDLRCPERNIIHLDGRDVGKSVCISTDALHFAFTHRGSQGLVGAPHQGHLDTLIEEFEFQLDANPDLMSSIALSKYGKPKIHRKPSYGAFNVEYLNLCRQDVVEYQKCVITGEELRGCQGRRKTRPEGRRENRPLPVREGVDLLDRAGVAGAEACASVQAARLGRSGRHPSPIVATCGEG